LVQHYLLLVVVVVHMKVMVLQVARAAVLAELVHQEDMLVVRATHHQ
jgi:hypothetical protein